jgi:hypothetical protein
MRFDIEFFEHNSQSGGKTIRRNSGLFANEQDAETYGLVKRPEIADGFRIWKNGILRKTVSIKSE